MPRDYYEVLGVGRDAERGRDQESLPPARAGAAPRRQRPRPRGRGEVQGGGRGLRGPLRRRAPPDLRRLRARGPALRRIRPGRRLRLDRRHLPGLLRRRRLRLRRRAAARRRRRHRRRGRSRARRGRDRRAPRGHLRRRRPLRALPRQRRRAGDADLHLRALRRRRRAAPGDADPVRADGPRPPPATPAAAPARSPRRRARPAAAAAAPARAGPARSRSRPGSKTASGCGSPAPATPASRGRPPATSTSRSAVAEDERFQRDGTDLISVVSIPATEAMLGTDGDRADARRRGGDRGRAGHPAGAPKRCCAALGLPRLGGRRRGNQRVILNVFVPTNLSDEQREIAERLDETLEEENLEPQHGEGLFGRVRRAFG